MKNGLIDNWYNAFSPELKNSLAVAYENYEKTAKEELIRGSKVYPAEENIFSAFNFTPLDKVKVVILGQDPYHEPMQANGMAFSVSSNVPLPPSLKNIFKELKYDLGGELRTNGDLSDWAEQDILLLNTSLTVIEHKANSMIYIWQDFTDGVISLLNNQKKPIVFVLWGNNARNKKALITGHNII